MIRKSIARAYARAIIKSVKSDQELIEIKNQLEEVFEFVSSSRELFELLSKPIISVEKRKELLNKIISKLKTGKIATNLLNLLVSGYRINYLSHIIDILKEEIDRKEGIIRGEFVTANSVDELILRRAEERLSRLLNRKVVLKNTIDKNIIGGAIVRIGSIEIDGSVARRIKSIENINIF
jgi:F-type H+-transporting ATPase subunit delta